jgi:hypothetical protein
MALTIIPPSGGGTGLTSSGSSGNILTSNGTAWTSIALATIQPSGGGTGLTSSGNVGNILTSNGTIWESKVLLPRIGTNGATLSGNITPTSETADQYNISGLTGNITLLAPSGTPSDGQRLILRIKDNGTTRTITWNAIYRVIGVTLPTSTSAGKITYVGLIYNTTDVKWDVVAVGTET